MKLSLRATLVGLALVLGLLLPLSARLLLPELRFVTSLLLWLAIGVTMALAVGSLATRLVSTRLRQPIAEQRDAVAALSAERDRLRAALMAHDDVMLVVDRDSIVALANTAAQQVFGADESAREMPLEGQRLSALNDDPAIGTLVKKGLEGSSTSATITLVADAPRTPGAARTRHMQTSVVPLATGHALLVMHDVTELRRLETVRRDFVENVSHELRTPVSVVRVNAETLLDGALDDEVHARRFVERIHRSAERLSHLVTDLLDLSRIEAGHYATRLDRVAVLPAIDVVMEDLSVHADKRNIVVAVDVPDDTVVRGDVTGLEQILQNLLENAVRYTPAGGRIAVRAITTDDSVRIEVEDNGPGIAERHRARIFERFYRVDAGRSREVGGTGLGLAIVRHLTELMGGSVGVESAASGGSLFWVALTRATNSLPPPAHEPPE